MQLRAAMYDGAHKQLSDTIIDARVCECCPTAVALAADGPVAAYRNRSAGEIRDIYVTRLAAGRWTMPVPVHRDNFKIEGCPVNGPAVAARGRTSCRLVHGSQRDEPVALAFSRRRRTFGAPSKPTTRSRSAAWSWRSKKVVPRLSDGLSRPRRRRSSRFGACSRTAPGRPPLRWRISPARAIRGWPSCATKSCSRGPKANRSPPA